MRRLRSTSDPCDDASSEMLRYAWISSLMTSALAQPLRWLSGSAPLPDGELRRAEESRLGSAPFALVSAAVFCFHSIGEVERWRGGLVDEGGWRQKVKNASCHLTGDFNGVGAGNKRLLALPNQWGWTEPTNRIGPAKDEQCKQVVGAELPPACPAAGRPFERAPSFDIMDKRCRCRVTDTGRPPFAKGWTYELYKVHSLELDCMMQVLCV